MDTNSMLEKVAGKTKIQKQKVTRQSSLQALLMPSKDPEVETQHYVAVRLEAKLPVGCKVLWERTSPLNMNGKIRVDLAVLTPSGKLKFLIEIKRVGEKVGPTQRAKYDELTSLHGIYHVIEINDGDIAYADVMVDWIVDNMYKSVGRLPAPFGAGTQLFNYDWSEMRSMEIMADLDRQLVIEHSLTLDSRPYHPAHLTAMILTSIIEEQGKIATDRFEIVRQLQAYYGRAKVITFIDSAITESMRKINKERADKYNIPYFTWDGAVKMGLKFDLILANPPYGMNQSSGGGKKTLYPIFFREALEMADLVAMVMPVRQSISAERGQLGGFLRTVRKHQISTIDAEYAFSVSQPDIKVVIASKAQTNIVTDTLDPLENYKEIYPLIPRLKPITGPQSLATRANEDPNGLKVIFKISKKGVEYNYMKKHVVDKERTSLVKRTNNLPWAVLVGGFSTKSGFHTTIIKNDGEVWSQKISAFMTNTEQDARKLETWLKDDRIIKEVINLRTLNGTAVIGDRIYSRLPICNGDIV